MSLVIWGSNMKKLIKFLSFSLICVMTLVCLKQFVFVKRKIPTEYSKFYDETQNTLDLVSIGNSTVAYGINPCIAWKNFGVTSYNISGQPSHPEIINLAINEVARTQSPKVIYIDINGLTFQKQEEAPEFIKRYVQAMPDGEAKQNVIAQYSFLTDNNSEKDLEIFENHNDYRNPDFWVSMNQLDYSKGYRVSYKMKKAKDVKTLDKTTILPIQDDGVYYLNKILDTCAKYPQINFIFGKTPRFLNENTINESYMLRSLIPTIQDKGYEYVDWSEYLEEMEFDAKTDSFDEHHLNIYGATKFTKFYISYLNDKYSICGTGHDEETENNFNDSYKKFEQDKEKHEKKKDKKDSKKEVDD